MQAKLVDLPPHLCRFFLSTSTMTNTQDRALKAKRQWFLVGLNNKGKTPGPGSPDQQAEISGHLFLNIAASWFPKAGAFAQKVQADIWAAAKAFPR